MSRKWRTRRVFSSMATLGPLFFLDCHIILHLFLLRMALLHWFKNGIWSYAWFFSWVLGCLWILILLVHLLFIWFCLWVVCLCCVSTRNFATIIILLKSALMSHLTIYCGFTLFPFCLFTLFLFLLLSPLFPLLVLPLYMSWNFGKTRLGVIEICRKENQENEQIFYITVIYILAYL